MPNSVASSSIRAELARAGKSQKDVAAWIGVHPSQVTGRMQGRIEWRLPELITIAKHLRVPISTLLDDSETSEAVTTR